MTTPATPRTPADHDHIWKANTGPPFCGICGVSQANAVNAHDALLAALRALVEEYDADRSEDDPWQWEDKIAAARALLRDLSGERTLADDEDAMRAWALAAERKATVERIGVQVDEYIAAFPSRNRTSLYGAALALRERLGQIAEQDALPAEPAGAGLRELIRDLAETVHQTGSLRDHADPNDKTGWNVHGIETCEDSLCVDALAALAATPVGEG